MYSTAGSNNIRKAIFQVEIRAIQFATMLLMLAMRAHGESHRAETPTPPGAPEPARRIVVSIPDCRLALIENGRAIRVYRVAVGAAISPSPVGKFRIARRVADPAYYRPGVAIPPGKDNPLGPRWIGLDVKGYGIHGTNEPYSIGHSASHGCIRMRNQDVQELFELVRVGDLVELHGVRDAETARLFGDPARGAETHTASAAYPAEQGQSPAASAMS